MAEDGTPIRAILAANIRRIADEREMSLNHIADFSGTSRSHLYAVLACERAATVDWVWKVAAAMKVAPSELLDDAA